MTKAEMLEKLAQNSGLSKKDVGLLLIAEAKLLKEVMAEGGEMHIEGVGRFYVGTRTARTARNPKTGESKQSPEKRVPKFSPSKVLKSAAAGE